MRNLVLMMLLAVSCAVINQPVKKKPAPLPNVEVPVQVEAPIKEVTLPPLEVTVPKIKYTLVGLDKYSAYIPRVEKYFQLLVRDKSILDGRKFDYNQDSAEQIRSKIIGGFDVQVRAFTPNIFNALKWRYTIAYHEDWVIYINTKKMRRPDCSIINTIAHESTHAWGYGHGDDDSTGKQNSFPYWAGNKAEELCLAGKI